jgi:hypothetical protein
MLPPPAATQTTTSRPRGQHLHFLEYPPALPGFSSFFVLGPQFLENPTGRGGFSRICR